MNNLINKKFIKLTFPSRVLEKKSLFLTYKIGSQIDFSSYLYQDSKGQLNEWSCLSDEDRDNFNIELGKKFDLSRIEWKTSQTIEYLVDSPEKVTSPLEWYNCNTLQYLRTITIPNSEYPSYSACLLVNMPQGERVYFRNQFLKNEVKVKESLKELTKSKFLLDSGLGNCLNNSTEFMRKTLKEDTKK
jgi:hypothetical protein